MAGSRLDKIGTIFSRSTGLLRSGAIKYQDRPVWYDVYRVFPPKYEPYVERQPERTSDIPDILYKEDKPRAEFFKRYGPNPGGQIRNLSEVGSEEEASQSFIKRYQEVEKSNPSWTHDQIFEVAAEGLQFSRVSAPGKTTGRRMRQSPSSDYERNEDSDNAIMEGDFEDQQQQISRRQGARKTPIISAESLRSLFEEAKDKQNQEEVSKTSNSHMDSVKNGDKDKS